MNIDKLLLVLMFLILFGVFYDMLEAWLDKKGYARGYMGFVVAFGVLITVMGGGVLIGWQAAGIVLVCFVASGTPMVLGSVIRHVRSREQEILRLRREILDGNGEKTLAE